MLPNTWQALYLMSSIGFSLLQNSIARLVRARSPQTFSACASGVHRNAPPTWSKRHPKDAALLRYVLSDRHVNAARVRAHGQRRKVRGRNEARRLSGDVERRQMARAGKARTGERNGAALVGARARNGDVLPLR